MAIKLTFEPNHYKVGVLVVSIDACGVSQYALKKVDCPARNFMTNAGLDCAIIFHGMFKKIENSLLSPAKKAVSNKVHDISCNIAGGKFNIRVKTESTGTALRKIAGKILSQLNPTRLGAYYKNTCKLIGIKPSQDSFIYCSKQIMKSADSEIHIFVGAKIKALPSGFLDVLKNKYVSKDPPKGGNPPIAHDHIEPMPDIRIVESHNDIKSAIKKFDMVGTDAELNGTNILYYPSVESIITQRKKSYNANNFNHHMAVCTAVLHGEMSADQIKKAYN